VVADPELRSHSQLEAAKNLCTAVVKYDYARVADWTKKKEWERRHAERMTAAALARRKLLGRMDSEYSENRRAENDRELPWRDLSSDKIIINTELAMRLHNMAEPQVRIYTIISQFRQQFEKVTKLHCPRVYDPHNRYEWLKKAKHGSEESRKKLNAFLADHDKASHDEARRKEELALTAKKAEEKAGDKRASNTPPKAEVKTPPKAEVKTPPKAGNKKSGDPKADGKAGVRETHPATQHGVQEPPPAAHRQHIVDLIDRHTRAQTETATLRREAETLAMFVSSLILR